MSLTNKVAQFDADSDLVNAWVHGPASGAGSTVTTESGTVRTPAKLIADNEAELQAVIDLTSDWANGNTTTTAVLGGMPVKSPAKLIADLDASINVGGLSVLAQATTQAGISTAQAAIATIQAGLATTNGAAQVTLATAEKTAAVVAKTAAESARDVAVLTVAGLFISTATGLAATTNGQYFNVIATEPDEYAILYLNSTGTAIEQKRYPSSAAISALSQVTYGPAFVVTDDYANKVFEVTATGGLKSFLTNIEGTLDVTTDGQVKTSSVEQGAIGSNSAYVWAVTDTAGNAIIAVDALGRLVANFALVPNTTTPSPTPGVTSGKRIYDYSINQIFGYGQSLSVGQAVPAISTVQSHDSLMFTKGMRPQYDYASLAPSDWYSALVPAVEEDAPVASGYAGTLGETPCLGTVDMIKQRILIEDGKSFRDHQYQLLISSPGWGATTVAQLSKGGVYYPRMMEQTTYAHNLAIAANKTHAVQAVTWTQGESDYISGTSKEIYKTLVNQLIVDFNADIKAITGQTKSIPLISYQTSTHHYYPGDHIPDIAQGQFELERENPDYHIACAMYVFDYWAGGHLVAASSRQLGAYYGLAYKRLVINQEAWRPLTPLSTVRQGKILEVTFNSPSGKLAIDTSQVAFITNYGFDLVNSAGVSQTISFVEVVDTDRIRITAAATIPAGCSLRYGWAGTSPTGRGNLRDSQGDTITFAVNGTNKRMDNWCLIFEIGV